MSKKKLGILGCGKLNTIVAEATVNGILEEYEIIGVYSRTRKSAEALADKTGAPVCDTLEELMAKEPDIVSEAAGVAAVKEYAETILKRGADLAVISIGAFADQDFFQRICDVGRKTGRKVHIASGAIGGFDVMNTARLMSDISASFHSVTGPQYLRGTPVFREELMESREPEQVFSGNARKAIELLPHRVNVAVAASLASAGPEDTEVTITSSPGFIGDEYTIEVKGEEIRAELKIFSRTSRIAGYSLVALLKNLASPIQFQ